MNNRVYLAGGLILFRQVLDSSDGFIARKYKLTSEFGAMYDKISDTVDDTLIAAVVLYKLRNVVSKYRWIFLFLFVNYLFINFAKLRRGMCIRRHNECSDPEIRHLILKNTKQFSYLEEKIMLVAGIIILYKYIK
jgi:phosphatidylglycerophosphate synthase